PEARAVGVHEGVGRVDLRDRQAVLVEVTLQGARIGLQGDGGVVPQSLDEVLPMHHAELDVRQRVLDGRLDGRAEIAVEGAPVVGMPTQLDHGGLLQWRKGCWAWQRKAGAGWQTLSGAGWRALNGDRQVSFYTGRGRVPSTQPRMGL